MSVIEWLQTNNYYSKSKIPDKVESHTLYDGGLVYVPDDVYYQFLKLYAKDFKNKEPLHFIEKRSPVYKFMIDLDIYDTEYLSKEEIIKVCSFIISIVCEFYEHDYMAIVCNCTGTPKLNKNDQTQIHTGLHIIFPKLFVVDDTSKMIRNAILQKAKIDKFKEHWNWIDVFDIRIYNANGFTMVGSSKLNSDRVYVPYLVLDKTGSLKEDYLERLKTNHLDTMLDTSLRYIPSAIKNSLSDKGHLPTKIPEWFSLDESEKELVSKKPSNKISNKIGYTQTDDLVYKIIIGMINKHMPEYKNEIGLIKDIFRYPNKDGTPNKDGALLVTSNSKYCKNVGREHSSCGIYFYANRNGLCQKCLCPCNNLNGRKFGLCSEYTSEYYKFDKDIEVLLFKDSKLNFREVPDDPFNEPVKEDNIQASNKEPVKEDNIKTSPIKTSTKDPKEKKNIKKQKVYFPFLRF